nr:dienelactone hydrolase [Desulfovibrio sp. Huiquan2017]
MATEIWGRTPHVDELAAQLRPHARRVTVADPYDGRDPRFPDEGTAYVAYRKQGGLAPYAHRVTELAAKGADPVLLAGFSAGAAAAWAACAENIPILHACCFYGSAIRTMTGLIPRAPVDLIFPAFEPRFDVAALAADLAALPLVTCRQARAGHGFMNPLSANHDAPECRRWTAWLLRLARTLGKNPA